MVYCTYALPNLTVAYLTLSWVVNCSVSCDILYSLFLSCCVRLFDWTLRFIRSISQVTEMDVLRMVGLDAYMLLRYHVVCYK